MAEQFDLIVVGAGPGGYVAASSGQSAWNEGSGA